MSEKPTVLFVCNEIGYSIFNRRSAIDSILCSILLELKDSYTILINGDPFEPPNDPEISIQRQRSKMDLIKAAVPRFLKERIKVSKLLKNSENTIEYIKNKSVKPDVVIELYKLGSNIGPELARHYNCPYVVYFDSPVVEQYEDIWKRKAPAREMLVRREKDAVSAADVILVYSKPVGAYLKNLGADGRIVYYATLDYSRLTPVEKVTDNVTTIGFIGSFMPWHRVDMLIDAFAELAEMGHDSIRLLLVGDGETAREMRVRAAATRVSDRIEFTGFVDGNSLEQCKARIDIGVMPGSNWYGIPTKVFEYGACRIASVAPDTPTIADIFSPREVCLFKWDDQKSLVDALHGLISDNSKINGYGNNLYERIQKDYTLSYAKNLYISVLSEVLEGGKKT